MKPGNQQLVWILKECKQKLEKSLELSRQVLDKFPETPL